MAGQTATYKEIQEWVRTRHGFVPQTCWITHVKELNNLPTAGNRQRVPESLRVKPCPVDKRDAIEDAMRHFGMLGLDNA